jgi:hypothetical protein
MATISDPAQHGPHSGPEGDAWGVRAVNVDRPQVPHAREPSRFERIGTPAFAVQETNLPPPVATHHTIVVVDIEGFGNHDRSNASQVRVRRGLYNAMRHSFDAAGIPWDRCEPEDRGDGALILAPADLPKALFVDKLPGLLAEALTAHNKRHPAMERIRLRLALHAGEILRDEHGVTSSSINHTFRILDADSVKSAFAESTAVLAIVGSAWFYDEVIRQSDWSKAVSYVVIEVRNKETNTQAWVRMVGRQRARRRETSNAVTLHRRLTQST